MGFMPVAAAGSSCCILVSCAERRAVVGTEQWARLKSRCQHQLSLQHFPSAQAFISDKTRAKALAPPGGEPPNRIKKQLLAEVGEGVWGVAACVFGFLGEMGEQCMCRLRSSSASKSYQGKRLKKCRMLC